MATKLVHQATYWYKLVENEVGSKQHEEAELIALADVTKPCNLIGQSAEASSRH